MSEFLLKRIVRQPRGPVARAGLGLALGAVALGVRLALAPFIGLGAPYGAFILAVLAATVFGGIVAGVSAVALLTVGGVAMMVEAQEGAIGARRIVGGVAFFWVSSGLAIWMITLLRDALSRETAARESERLLKLELHHRVKNTLAVVQSLADQTFRGAVDTQAARRDFAARLSALADAHDLLVDTGWREVTMDALAARALAPFHVGRRIALDGPPAPVAPEAAVALTLCLHELATNAAKYGALSGEHGRVDLAWRVDETHGGRPRLSLDWGETGGPAPSPGDRQGFGVRLLNRALAAQPNAQAVLSLPPEGARWTAAFDL